MPPAPRQRRTSKRLVPAKPKPRSATGGLTSVGAMPTHILSLMWGFWYPRERGAGCGDRGVLACAGGALRRAATLLHLVSRPRLHRLGAVGATGGAGHERDRRRVARAARA